MHQKLANLQRPLALGLLAIALSLFTWAAPVWARSCHRTDGHEICLDQVQRSAKYHWRYRVNATVDGQPQPLTRYDCRDRTQTPLAGAQKGTVQPFSTDGVGTRVCALVHRER